MVIAIVRTKKNKLDVLEISQGDWDTMTTALSWKESGNWERVKRYVYRNNLNKKKTRHQWI